MTMLRWPMIRRILLGSAALALAGFAVLVLIGLLGRYSQETAALGFRGIYERYLAFQAGFPNDAAAYRVASENAGRRQTALGLETAAFEE